MTCAPCVVLHLSSSRPGDTPGSHVSTKVLQAEHPLTWGYQQDDWVFRGNLPLYSVREADRGMTVMQFGSKTMAQMEEAADNKAGVVVPSH